ncbi:hypothetical protein QTP88_000656 [Uroleucon formosanum]
MDNEQRQSILEICEHYQDIFYLTGDTSTCTDTLTHKINIPENQEPIYKRPYRLPHAQMAEIDSQIKQMEKDDIIEPSFSPWNAPLLLVKKKLDASQIPKFRIVVDFRVLNKVTINEYHPLPNITEILDQLGQCNLFSIIELASGFYQIKLDEKSKELTAFSTNQGHWHFKKMAMGLKTSPCSFQRLMNNVMAGIVGIKCLVYLDDIIIYGKGLLDHNEKLRDVFERLRNHNLKIQPTKCEFLKQQCMYLGHIISENGIQPDPEKIKSVLQFPIPASVKEIKSFLGLSGYYRKFIKSYSLISKPMTNLLRKDVTFNWDTSCQEAFDKLKNILCSKPILQYPDFTKPFIVTTDASGKALGAILSQGEVSQDLPIAYASRTLSKCESNYSTTELECLAIIFAVKTFRPYLYGRKFIILSDHRALSWLFNLKDPLSKLARWRILLEEYDYEIKYKPGVLNSNVDALSRMYTIHEIKEESYPAFLNKFETQLITNKRVKEVNGSLIESPEEYHIVSEIEKHYNFMSGVNYEIKQKFGNGQKLAPSKEIGENGPMIRYVFRNTDIDVIICSKLEFTDEEKLMIFKQCHDSIIGGHVGIHRTIKKIKTQFNWRGLKEDVIEYIKNCESCQKGKVTNKKVKQPMLITSTSSEPFEKIFLDIVGPIVTTLLGNTYILTLQDDLTKYLMGIALPNHQANTIAEAFVTNFVCTHGIPQTILTDQGTDFLRKYSPKILVTCFALQMALAQTKPYRISRLTQENGMYFENQGPLRLTNSDWKLLIYVKLDNFNQRTKDTMDFYKRTLIICNDLTIAYEGMFKTTCDNFKLTSNSLKREVSRIRFYMLQSIDETDTVTREKRGLVNLVGRVQKTLFGTLDDTNAELYDRQIEKLQSSQQNLLKIIDKQTSVLKATANTFKEANKMEAQINRLNIMTSRGEKLTRLALHNNIKTESRENVLCENALDIKIGTVGQTLSLFDTITPASNSNAGLNSNDLPSVTITPDSTIYSQTSIATNIDILTSWKRNISKIARNSGKEYEGHSKNPEKRVKAARKIKSPCQDKCRLKCTEKITDDDRMSVFNAYWNLGDIAKQREFIHNCTTEIKPKYRYVREGGQRPRRNHNAAFFFNLGDRRIRVCKIFFENTLAINDPGAVMAEDKRGKHGNQPKMNETVRNRVTDHIKRIPKIESHYTRKNTTKHYIEGGRTITDIYNDYLSDCKKDNVSFCNFNYFYNIFTNEFNLSFFQPKKDQCETCVAYENASETDKVNLKEYYDQHLVEKELSRKEKDNDKQTLADKAVLAIYDLQAVIPLPKGESNELGSCVLKYIEKHIGTYKNVVFYSDNCSGQQKNQFMLAAYIFALRKFDLNSITHKFLIKGHTQNEGDSVHSLIERKTKQALKSGPIYTPEGLVSLIRTAKRIGEPFSVNELSYEDFFDLKLLASEIGSLRIVKNTQNQPVKFKEIKMLKVQKDYPNSFFYKHSYGEADFMEAIIIRKVKILCPLKPAFNQKPGISEAKKNDLMRLIDKNLIPIVYKTFYDSLQNLNYT